MKNGAVVLASLVLLGAAFEIQAARAQSTQAQEVTTDGPGTLVLPVSTKVELAVTAPLWTKTAKTGDALYAQTSFPVTAGSSIAIPAGTYVQGIVKAVTGPTRKANRADIQVLFTTIIFANGYTIVLPDGSAAGTAAAAPAATAAKLTVQVGTQNDLLLDNGAQMEMTLAAPLALDATQVARAIPLTRPLELGKFRSATLCRPTPGTPGTPGSPDTVIPGSPGTPSTTIPGGPDMPDITIPGTPATPDTIIPGTPGTPGFAGTSCPAAPIVISSEPLSLPLGPIQAAKPSTTN